MTMQNESFLSLNDSNLMPLEKQSSNFLAFEEDELWVLLSKNKVADEKNLVQSHKLKTFKYILMDVQVFQKCLSKIVAIRFSFLCRLCHLQN